MNSCWKKSFLMPFAGLQHPPAAVTRVGCSVVLGSEMGWAELELEPENG